MLTWKSISYLFTSWFSFHNRLFAHVKSNFKKVSLYLYDFQNVFYRNLHYNSIQSQYKEKKRWKKTKQYLNTVSYTLETEMHRIKVVVFQTVYSFKKNAKMNDLVTLSSTESWHPTMKNSKQRLNETQQRPIYGLQMCQSPRIEVEY